jgi:hypothetical protein
MVLRQTVVADTDGMGQPEGTDPGEAWFWPAPGLTWFGDGLGRAVFWVWPEAWP